MSRFSGSKLARPDDGVIADGQVITCAKIENISVGIAQLRAIIGR